MPLSIDPEFICPGRSFETFDFPQIDAGEQVTLAFNFADELPNGGLTGNPTVNAQVTAGTDPNAPADLWNGSPAFDATLNYVLVPVIAPATGVGCVYYLTVTANGINRHANLTIRNVE